MQAIKKIGSLILCLLVTLGVGYLIMPKVEKNIASEKPNPNSTPHISPSAQASGKANRQTELMTPVTKENPESELNVKLNDPEMKKKWGLEKTDAFKAWSVHKGSKDITVAVIDTGCDIKHKDLKNNLWTNKGESGIDSKGRNKATNGIDDDRNGFVDDYHGWNFVSQDHNLKDNHGHGTHIFGILGAEGDNGFGISGVSQKVSVMCIKYFDPTMVGDNLKNTIKSIRYAIKMGADIINYSGGGLEYSAEEFKAVKEAEQKGILFVAAAGNERSNSDVAKYYPADYTLSNIISVTAIDPALKILSSSNYGVNTVDIAAPGQNIVSTLPGNKFGEMTGTSQATAFVSGVAALIMAYNRDFKAKDVKKYILKTGDSYEWLRGKTGTSKKLNIYKALTTLDQGVGASGVVASNTMHMKHGAFKLDPNAPKLEASESAEPAEMKQLGNKLMNFFDKN